jgi:YVTN family beta-propeller protein
VDPRTHTIYVANGDDDTVSVINGRTSTVTATVAVGHGPVEVAVHPKTDTIYVTNNGSIVAPSNTVSVISGRTNTVTATLTVGSDPEGVAASSKTNTAYVANSGDGTVSVLGPCPG